MRKIIIGMLLFAIVFDSVAQEVHSASTLTRADYLQKSKSQKIAAFVLLGIGATCIGIAAPGNVSFDILPVLAIGGGSSLVGSLVLFLASSRNKKKASMSTLLQIQKLPQLNGTVLSSRAVPAIALQINF